MDVLLPIGTYTQEWTSTPSVPDADTWQHVANGMGTPDDTDYMETNASNNRFSCTLGEIPFTGPIGTLRIAFRYSADEDVVFPTPGASFVIVLDAAEVTVARQFDVQTFGDILTGIVVFTSSDYIIPLTGAVWNAASSRRMRITSAVANLGEDGDPPPGPWFSGD